MSPSKRCVITLMGLIGIAVTASCQDTIVWTDGPAFQFPDWTDDYATIDLNGDGLTDVAFRSWPPACSPGLPAPPGCTQSYNVAVLARSGLLSQSEAEVLFP